MKKEDIDLDKIFGELGVRLLHTGGIYAALSEQSGETMLAVMEAAKKHGTVISYDLNYRPSMWDAIGGVEKTREENREAAKFVYIMMGNEEDFTACLGLHVEGQKDLKHLDPKAYGKMQEELVKLYPNFKVVATSLRTVHSATVNDWSGICYAEGQVYEGMSFPKLEIFDRVGGGDSFASGLLYGLMEKGDPALAIQYAVCHGALAMTTPGDTTMARKEEVEALMKGAGARVLR